ncbi:unnamed protein product [Prorocentrum cordatum]|uniref:Uncharacterized protein n=1 Tax=Prorocentrum cordatum TaxID=2364126 RepID=A0ABN9UQU2_9DINO|nr:unnamed protein product [Polarella glacialis]
MELCKSSHSSMSCSSRLRVLWCAATCERQPSWSPTEKVQQTLSGACPFRAVQDRVFHRVSQYVGISEAALSSSVSPDADMRPSRDHALMIAALGMSFFFCCTARVGTSAVRRTKAGSFLVPLLTTVCCELVH